MVESTDPMAGAPAASGSVTRGARWWPMVIATAVVAVVTIAIIVRRPPEPLPPSGSPVQGGDQNGGTENITTGPPPAELLAAERYVADPGASTLRALIEAIGGLDSVVVGETTGAFDLVRFDPTDDNRLIASMRSSYGEAENHDVNELWTIEDGGVQRRLLSPELPHDFVHFNVDGTLTRWVKAGDDENHAPRIATVIQPDGSGTVTTPPLFASRFAALDGTVFALTNDGDYYSTADTYNDLVAAGVDVEVLAPGSGFAWIDLPTAEHLVAYPREPGSVTRVWHTGSLDLALDHPLAGRAHQRSAVSGDGRTALGVTFGGRLERIDLATGEVVDAFGSLDPRGVDRPIALNRNGRLAATVDRSGTVSLWWVGDDIPVARLSGDAAQPRWVSERHGARSTSVLAASGERIALRAAADPETPVTWTVVDIGIDGWIARACELAGRTLTTEERSALDLTDSVACV